MPTHTLSRLAFNLGDYCCRAQKVASVARGKTIGQVIEDGPDFSGIKARKAAQDILRNNFCPNDWAMLQDE